MDYETFKLLQRTDNLTINNFNSFHAELQQRLITDVRSVSSKYLPLYVQTFAFIKKLADQAQYISDDQG